MILADENIDIDIINSIRKIGIEVFSIYESNRGLSDEQIIQISKSPPRIILTEDKDFGEWVFSHHEKEISVILLRYSYKEIDGIISKLTKLLEDLSKNLFGKYTTITINKIRIREI